MSVEVLTVASFVMAGVQTISAGRASSNAAMFEAQAAQQRAEENRMAGEQAELQALIEANQRREEHEALMSANIVRAGYDPYSSPSWLALKDANEDDMERDVELIMFSGRDQKLAAQAGARGEELGAAQAVKRAKSERRSALFGAAGSFLQAGVAGAKLYRSSTATTAAKPAANYPKTT